MTELCGKLGLIEALDAGIGPVKQRQRGFTGGQVLAGMAAAQLAGEDFLVGTGPGPRRCGGPADHAGAGAGRLDRDRDRAPAHREALARRGDRAGAGDRADGGSAARASGPQSWPAGR